MEEILNQPPAAVPLAERLARPYRIPLLSRLEHLLRNFSPFERAMLYVFSALLGLSVFGLLALVNINLTEVVPSRGGTLIEGVVGTPRSINPLLAVSEADRDLSALVYSGLMRATPENTFIPDLAERYDISEDGTVYTFTIRDNATFHDGVPVTAGDVAFTIAMAQNPDVKSPHRADWEGVVVEEVGTKTVRITLPHPYAPFLESATLGILPKHRWQDVPITEFPYFELNTHPIGSGPFAIEKVSLNSNGTPERYSLAASKTFALGRPYLDGITFYFYPNEDALISALETGRIETAAGITPDQMNRAERLGTVLRVPLPRIFAVFLNQTKAPAFADPLVREALAHSLDKKAIIDNNLLGYGVPIDGPILDASETTAVGDAASIGALLDKAGWKKGADGIRMKKGTRLAFSIATADTVELAGTADSVARAWRALGADVTVKVFSGSDLMNTVIRPRDYQALLFGEVVGRSNDLYAFWHSSQRNDPGLNVALYANITTDKLLASARSDPNPETRAKKITSFVEIIKKEVPAVFLYAPQFIYVIPKDLAGVRLGSLSNPAERYLNVYEWHRETERVWSVFAPNE